MGQDYKGKIFKSGNSLALRLPKALGLQEGTEMTVREEKGKFTFEAVDTPKKKFRIDKVWGSATGLELLRPEDRVMEERSLSWDANETPE